MASCSTVGEPFDSSCCSMVWLTFKALQRTHGQEHTCGMTGTTLKPPVWRGPKRHLVEQFQAFFRELECSWKVGGLEKCWWTMLIGTNASTPSLFPSSFDDIPQSSFRHTNIAPTSPYIWAVLRNSKPFNDPEPFTPESFEQVFGWKLNLVLLFLIPSGGWSGHAARQTTQLQRKDGPIYS